MDAPYPRHRPVSVEEARAADREASQRFGIPSIVLMEHAGRGLARHAVALRGRSDPVVIVCGPGNNGGDGYACARFLASWGVPHRVVRVAPLPRAGDAALEAARCAEDSEILVAEDDAASDHGVLARALDGAAVVVDAVFGVGLSRPMSAHYVAVVERLLATREGPLPPNVLAADVPSGLDADTGRPLPVAVRAYVTAAMGMPKRGTVDPSPGAAYAGRVVEVDVGLPAAVHRPYLAAPPRP
jgi:NAD(P)H-hydrate epimerase